MQTAEPRPLLIQGAISTELDLLLQSLSHAKAQVLHGYPFTCGTLDGHPVIISQTHVGMVNAATATAIGILSFAPCALINQGTAGAHDPALYPGDIVIGARLINLGAFTTPWADTGAGVHPETWAIRDTRLGAGSECIKVSALTSNETLVRIAEQTATGYAKGAVTCGTVGTSDMFNRELDRIHQLRERHHTSCEEMEAFAAAQVCAHMSVPFLSIRVISNNELHQQPYDPTTGADCQRFVLQTVRALIAHQQPIDRKSTRLNSSH